MKLIVLFMKLIVLFGSIVLSIWLWFFAIYGMIHFFS